MSYFYKDKFRCMKFLFASLSLLSLFVSLLYILQNGEYLHRPYIINTTHMVRSDSWLKKQFTKNNFTSALPNKHNLTVSKSRKAKLAKPTPVDPYVNSSTQLPYQSKLILKKGKKITETPIGIPFNAYTWDNRTADIKRHYLLLYWSKLFNDVVPINKPDWPYAYVGDSCPVSCEVTNDRTRAKDADAFVLHARDTHVLDLPPIKSSAPLILQTNENPVYTPVLRDANIMSQFNLLISYRLDSDFPSPIYPMPSLSEPVPFNKRRGNVLAVFTNCERVRTEYMRQLMQHIEVHSYGSCLQNNKGLVRRYAQEKGKNIFKRDKVILERLYKFTLVFLNQDCDYFIDDRLTHAFESGSVPVYMGTNKIDEFLPGNLKNSIIRVSSFKSPLDLAIRLKYLSGNETAYNEYLAWKKNGIGDLSNTTIGRWWKPKHPLFCQVCMRLAKGDWHSSLKVDMCEPRSLSDWNL